MTAATTLSRRAEDDARRARWIAEHPTEYADLMAWWASTDAVADDLGRYGHGQTDTEANEGNYKRAGQARPDAPTLTPEQRIERTFARLADEFADRKVEVCDVDHQLAAGARAWLRSYDGTFEFLTSMKERGARSDAQVKGVLNCMRADLLRAPKPATPSTPAPEPESGVDLALVPAGRYAYQPADGQAQFVLIDRPADPAKPRWHGYTFVKAKHGPNEERLGSLRPGQSLYRGPQQAALASIASDPRAASLLYGRLLGECGVCGRDLTNAESREAGIGPVCASKAGW